MTVPSFVPRMGDKPGRPKQAGSRVILRSIYGNGSQIWVAGDSGTVLTSVDGGDHWSRKRAERATHCALFGEVVHSCGRLGPTELSYRPPMAADIGSRK